nr:IS982 family transposase [Chloroflexota bacterium]
MINDFDDFCTCVYVIVDDIWQQIAPLFKRPGPVPEVSDSELITMALVGECRGWHQETELISNWHEHRDLFPSIPERSRFNRRRRNLMFAINLIRKTVLQMMDLAQDNQCVIDSLPVPVVEFYLVPSSTGDWKAHGARFGKVSSKKETIFGYKLHLLITLNGLILDFELAPANAHDLKVGTELLTNHTNLDVVGDKGYISAKVAAQLLCQNNIRLLTLPRRNQKRQLPQVVERLINSVRQIIETVNGQLAGQFNIERTYAHSFWGLCARLYTKL